MVAHAPEAPPAFEVLTRMFAEDAPPMTPEAAEWILRLRFADPDHERYQRLSDQSKEPGFTEAQAAELEEILDAADLLALLQSRARLTLRRPLNTLAPEAGGPGEA